MRCFFTGTTGSGHVIFVAKDHLITGSDVTGGSLDGTFTDPSDGNIDVDANMVIPTAGMIVTGFVNGGQDIVHRMTATIPKNFSDGQPVGLNSPTGPVKVIFRKLREI